MKRATKHPIHTLLGRYRDTLRLAWSQRAALAGPQRQADELAFLPAALSLQETPVHPAPRILAKAIITLFCVALGWACIGTVDIVATAPGRIIVSERSKTVQPLEAAVIRAIHVRDGDRVQQGQLLVELDPTAASADKANVQEQIQAATSEALRAGALLGALQGGKSGTPVLGTPDAADWSAAAQADARQQMLSEWHDIQAKLAKLDAEAARREAERMTARQTLAKLQSTLPMAKTREADYLQLVKDGFVSSHLTQDKTRERVELERDLATAQARLNEAQSALSESQATRAAYKMETLHQLSDRKANAQTKLAQLQQDQTKASQRERQTQLLAPVAGVVQQLAVHSVGGVVTPAQALMVVVPERADVTAEVAVANLDIGFVRAGQEAEIKLETFPYTKYGTVAARVAVVSADAVADEKKGTAFFPATVKLQRTSIAVDGTSVPISPGMAVTAEIKTGKRRLIEYLLAPIQRAGSESLRER
ncbi:MAG: HlyD family type I secretion periplasmic adaptor subunit [Rhodoferax sp.]